MVTILKATILVSVIGIIGLNSKGKVAGKILFKKDPTLIARNLIKIEEGTIIEDIANLINFLKNNGYSVFVFENSKLAKNVEKTSKVSTETKALTKSNEAFRRNISSFAVETEFVANNVEMANLIHAVSMEMSQIGVKKFAEKRDLLIVQSIQALDDLDKALNLLMNRVREWYGLHFPEMDRIIDKHETYVKLIKSLGDRENFILDNLIENNLTTKKSSKLALAAKSSMGASITELDVKQIQKICEQLLDFYKLREDLEEYIQNLMKEIAPNTSILAGTTLGARLISIAGGLENLAKMPASTIQVLGAEKALFRSLSTGAKPPKHGILFQHTLVHGAKKWHRGKISRILAGKLAIAIRTDAFSGKYLGPEIKKDLERRIKIVVEKKKIFRQKIKKKETSTKEFKKYRKSRRKRKRENRG
jgi:nucleolar protein 56